MKGDLSMNKKLVWLLVLVMVFSLIGCKKRRENSIGCFEAAFRTVHIGRNDSSND